MKKLMFVAVAGLAASLFADGITSANIVGYTSKAVEQAKFNLLSAQFDKVGGGRQINGLVTGVTGVDFDDGTTFLTTAPQILVLKDDGASYDFYYYLNDAWYDDGSEEGATKEGWADGAGNLVTDEISEGAGFWLKSPGAAATPNVAGEVCSDASVDVACGTGFQLVANAFPVEIGLNTSAMTSADIVGVDFDDGISFLTTASQILVLKADGASYDFYYYLNDAWYDDGSEEGATKAGWADGAGNLVSDTIPVMAGFWTKGTTGAFTLTFEGIK